MINLTSEEIEHQFKNSDIPTRLTILKALSEKVGLPTDMGESSLLLIIEAMGDSEWQVRKEAVSVMIKAKGIVDRSTIIQRLLDRIGHNDNVGRRNAAADLFVQWGKTSVPTLLLNLNTVNEDTRKVVIDVLGDIGDPRAISPLLTDILGGDSIAETSAGFADNLRSSALEAIGKIGPPEGVTQVIPFLSTGNPLLTFSAIKSLQLMKSPLAVPYLIEISEEKMFKRAALEALGAISDMKALPCLLADLHSESENIRRVTLKAIATLGLKQQDENKAVFRKLLRQTYNEQDYEFLLSLVNHSDPILKRGAIAVLGWVSEIRAVPMLMPLLNEYVEDVVAALSQMGRLILPEMSKLMERGLWEDERTRQAAANIWGEVADAESVPFLTDLLKDNSAAVREAAATALGKIKSTATISSLMLLLKDPYPEVQEAAVLSLLEMKSDISHDDLRLALREKSAHFRANAAILIGEIGFEGAISDIAILLKDSDEDVRRASISALGRFPLEKTVRFLLSALGDEDYKVRVAVLKVLEHGGANALLAELSPLAYDANMWVRAALAKTIGAVPGEVGLGLLRKLVNDSTGVVQIAALSALGSRTESEILSELLKKLPSEDKDIKKSAILALGVYGDPSALPFIIPLLDDPHWDLRASAVSAVASLSNVSLKIKTMANTDDDPLVRDAARFALSRLQGEIS
jgi:HEAT repeat protein